MARQRCFVGVVADIVRRATSAMASVTTTEPVVQVVQDRRGWEVYLVVAEKELHCAEHLLDAVKSSFREACQVSRCVRLIGNRNPWRNVRCGFRALIAFMEDETRACQHVYEFGECLNRAHCSYQHPRSIKRFFVAVKSAVVAPMIDSNIFKCEGTTSTFNSTQSAHSRHSTARARSGQSWQSVIHSGSVCTVKADGSSKSEGSPVRPLLSLPAHPHLHVCCESNLKHTRDGQAPPLHENALDLFDGSLLMSGFIISL